MSVREREREREVRTEGRYKRDTHHTTADDRLTMGSLRANRAGKAAAAAAKGDTSVATGRRSGLATVGTGGGGRERKSKLTEGRRGGGTKRRRRERKQEERRWEGSHEWRQTDAGTEEKK